MKRILKTLCIGLLATSTSLVAMACGGKHKPLSNEFTQAVEDNLQDMFEEHFEAYLKLNTRLAQAIGDYRYNDTFGNSLSPEHIAAAKALNDRFIQRADAVDRTVLNNIERIRLDFFRYELNMRARAEAHPFALLPINQFDSRANHFAMAGSGEDVHPFGIEQDYRDFLQRAVGFSEWVDSAIVQMQEGIRRGIVLPTVLVERVLPQLAAQYASADLTQSTFYAPLQSLPETLQGAAREQLVIDYQAGIREIIFPAYKRLHDFMATEYRAASVAAHGRDAIPGGKDWYQYLISLHTTTNMSADEIHTLGLQEVTRIRNEMDTVRQQVGFKGDLKAFFAHLSSEPGFFFQSKGDLVAGYTALKSQIDAVLPKFFSVTPKTRYEVRPVESFREQSAAGASYQPGTADGSRPGVFYINTYNLKAQPRWGMETLSLHEAAPGHHFQISIQQEMHDAPRFQRFSETNAFAEGWALYVESIGKEMGLFTDPYQYFGKLSDEMLRAMRLVVDTGLHAKGWSRERAIRYMLDNSAMTETDLTAEVERYMAIPGQALSYKIGQIKISELRRDAERALGDSFDVREFHSQVLLSGSLPMEILESKIDEWISASSAI